MRIRADNSFKASSEAETRFNKVIKQYDDYINKIVSDNRTWQLIAVMSVFLIIVSIIGWFVAINMRKESLLVVEVNELGRAKYIGEMRGRAKYNSEMVKDYMVEAVIRDFLDFTRSLHLDFEVMNENYAKAMSHCSFAMKEKLRDELIALDPNSMVGRVKIKPEIESALRVSTSTWQFDWYDCTYLMSGQEVSRERMRGVFTIMVQNEIDDRDRFNNPLGIYIIEYNIIFFSFFEFVDKFYAKVIDFNRFLYGFINSGVFFHVFSP
jgi:type IV secretory pathway TrbF-like protein